MSALSPSCSIALAVVIVLLASSIVVGAGNLPALPGPYQPMPFSQQGAGFGQTQSVQPQQNAPVVTNRSPTSATFPTHQFAVPYWMQNNQGNSNTSANQQVNAGVNFRSNQVTNQANSQPTNRAPQQFNNGVGWGFNANAGGYFGQPPSQFFPGNSARNGQNTTNYNSGFYPNQGYQNNNAQNNGYTNQGNVGGSPGWGGQGNGYGYGQTGNNWGGSNFPSPNGFNNGWQNNAPNTAQR